VKKNAAKTNAAALPDTPLKAMPARVYRGKKIGPEEAERLRALRAEAERERLGPDELEARGHSFTTMGELMATRQLVADLRAERERQGRTLREVAAAAGMDAPALSRIEKGKNLSPTIPTLARIAYALGKVVAFELREGWPGQPAPARNKKRKPAGRKTAAGPRVAPGG
jgi:hypothetical protein